MTATSPPPPPSTTPAPRHVPRSVIGTIWHDLAGYFSDKTNLRTEETICYSVHRSFFLWDLILFGWIASFIINHFPNHAVWWTWAYLTVLLYTFMLLLFDVTLWKLVISVGVFLLVLITAKYVEAVRHVVLVGHLTNHFRHLRPQMSGGFAAVISWVLFVPWIGMLLEAFRSGRKSFSPNGIEERDLGVGTELTDRSGLHFYCRYPDLLETILGFGSGSIIAKDSSGKVVKEWPRILGLFFKWKRVDSILQQRAAFIDNTQVEPVETQVSPPKAQEAHEG